MPAQPHPGKPWQRGWDSRQEEFCGEVIGVCEKATGHHSLNWFFSKEHRATPTSKQLLPQHSKIPQPFRMTLWMRPWRLAPWGEVRTRFGGGCDTCEGYVLSQEGPRQCRQEAGFFPGAQRVLVTGLQLPGWTQSTFRDWKPRPQAVVQGFQGPTRQHASQAPNKQFLWPMGLWWKKKQTKQWKIGEVWDQLFHCTDFSVYERSDS